MIEFPRKDDEKIEILDFGDYYKYESVIQLSSAIITIRIETKPQKKAHIKEEN